MLRWIMVEAARVVVNHDPGMRSFYERVKHRRGDQKAVVAVANKMRQYTKLDSEQKRVQVGKCELATVMVKPIGSGWLSGHLVNYPFKTDSSPPRR